jgi:hypothetical protein
MSPIGALGRLRGRQRIATETFFYDPAQRG